MAEYEESTTVSSLSLHILTPQRQVFEGAVESIETELVTGVIEVFPGHEPLLAPLAVGLLVVYSAEGTPERFAVHGGFLEVNETGAVVLADSAEKADEIDLERAQAARARAKERLDAVSGRGDAVEVDVDRARSALLRATTRIRVRQEQSIAM